MTNLPASGTGLARAVRALMPVFAVVLGSGNAAAELDYDSSKGTSPGIYARYTVTAPFISKANDATTKAQNALCKKLKGTPLIVMGDPSTEGQMVVEKYFSRDYQAVYAKGMIRKQLGVCDHQIVPYTRIVLRHARAGHFGNGFMLYEYNDSGKPPHQWTRRLVSLSGSTVKELLDMGALGPGFTKVMPVEKRKYAFTTCEMYATRGLEVCILDLDATKYPIAHLMLYQKVDHEGGETTAEAVELKKNIKNEVFFPPKDAPIRDADAKKKGAGKQNATEKWCEAQLKKTGINPCASNQDDARN